MNIEQFAKLHNCKPEDCDGIKGPLWPPGAAVAFAYTQCILKLQQLKRVRQNEI